MRISPICACPPCTARLISFALKSDALECTVILGLPLVSLSTSAANCAMFSVWKLAAGYGVGMSHFVLAMVMPDASGRVVGARACRGFMGFSSGVGGH